VIKKFIIILSSVMILSGQSPPEIFVDGEERDIKIRPNIAGTEVVLLGATPAGQREIIIEVVGPKRNITLQEKRRFLGLWLGLGKINYNNVPSYYNILSSKPLNEISDRETFNKLGLGLENLPLGKAEIINSDLKQRIFDKRLRTEMQNKGQFLENESSIAVRSGPGKVGLFSTEFFLPSNSLQGKYFVRYFTFRDGNFISYTENTIDLKQAGFSRVVWLTANNFPLLYGLLAVILSGLVGWLVSTIFRRLKIS